MIFHFCAFLYYFSSKVPHPSQVNSPGPQNLAVTLLIPCLHLSLFNYLRCISKCHYVKGWMCYLTLLKSSCYNTYIYQVIMLCVLNLHDVICQLYLNKAEKVSSAYFYQVIPTSLENDLCPALVLNQI